MAETGSGRDPRIPSPRLGPKGVRADPDRQPAARPWPGPAHLPGVALGPGRDTARNGMPAAAAGPGREAAVAAGLYGGSPDGGWYRQGLSRPALRPEVPEGETDSFDLPDPVKAIHALIREQHAAAQAAAEAEAG